MGSLLRRSAVSHFRGWRFGGACLRHVPPHRKTVYRVKARIDSPSGDKRYRARIYSVNSSNTIVSKLGDSSEVNVTSTGINTFTFQNDGVDIPASTRVAVVISRTHAGNTATASP